MNAIVTKRVLGSTSDRLKLPPQYGALHADEKILIDTNNDANEIFVFYLSEVFHNVAYYRFDCIHYKDSEKIGYVPVTTPINNIL